MHVGDLSLQGTTEYTAAVLIVCTPVQRVQIWGPPCPSIPTFQHGTLQPLPHAETATCRKAPGRLRQSEWQDNNTGHNEMLRARLITAIFNRLLFFLVSSSFLT